MMKIETKSKHVLFDASDIFQTPIEEVLGYHYESLFMWAVVRYEDGTMYTIPLYALAIKHKTVFND